MTAATVVRSMTSSRGTAMLADYRVEIGRMIRTADERPGRHVREAFRAGDFPVGIETFGRNEFDNGQMLRSGPEVLTQGKHLAADFAQVVHRLKKFRLHFAESEHDPALGHYLRRKLLGYAQNFERGPIFRARTDHRDRKSVV